MLTKTKLIRYSLWDTSVADMWHCGTDPDPHLWLKDSDPASDPNPAIFVSDLMATKT